MLFAVSPFSFASSAIAGPMIVALSPQGGPPTGRTRITVSGSGFTPTATLSCRFVPLGHSSSAGTVALIMVAKYLNSTSVMCSSSFSQQAGVVYTLQVTVNGVDYSPSSAASAFSVWPSPYVRGVQPLMGDLGGGTVVSVNGMAFVSSPLLACAFKFSAFTPQQLVLTVPAHYESASRLRCVAPAIPATVLSAASVASTQSVSVVALVEVTLNGVEWTTDGTEYLYSQSPHLLTLLPPTGPKQGGSRVVLRGWGMPATAALFCVFGSAPRVPAQWLSSFEVACATPALTLAAPNASTATGGVSTPVRLTVNDAEWSQMLHYTYAALPTVTAVVPPLSHPSSGTRITVLGSGFVSSPLLVCRFGLSTSTATFLNSSALICGAPTSLPLGTSQLRVSCNGQDFSSTHAVFTSAPFPRVLSVSPQAGPVAGGTTVEVMGSGFTNSSTACCRLSGWATVAATWVSPTVLRCQALPSPPPGFTADSTTTVEVSLNGVAFSSDRVSFKAHPMMEVLSVTPMLLPARGGALVTLRGKGFSDTGALACFFLASPTSPAALMSLPHALQAGAVRVAARFLTSTHLECHSPSSAQLSSAVSVHVLLSSNDQFLVPSPPSVSRSVELYPEPTLSTLQPSAGPLGGGTAVVIKGSGFIFTSELRCLFGRQHVPAVYLGPTALRCVTPPHSSATGDVRLQDVAVRISVAGSELSTQSLVFSYSTPILDLTIQPSGGPQEGGTVVQLLRNTGAFVPSQALKCRFGGLEVAAVFVSSSMVTCLSPARTVAEAVSLDVSSNGGSDFTNSGLRFVYQGRVLLASLLPLAGPPTGGPPLVVKGEGFVDSGALKCRFTISPLSISAFVALVSPDVPARWVSASQLQCSVPPIAFAAGATAGAMALTVSNNGVDFSSSALTFTVRSAMDVKGATPSSVPCNGGSLVTVTGMGFLPSSRLACLFGPSSVVAQRLSDSLLQCTAPPLPAGNVTLRVTTNGMDVSPGSVTLVVVTQARVTSLSPRSGGVQGGTVLTLTGSAFTASSTLRCRFQVSRSSSASPPVVVAASFVSPSTISCVSPPWPQQQLVTVEVSLNGHDFTSDGSMFSFQPSPVLLSLAPLSGPYSGGTVVTLFGAHFASTDTLYCRFAAAPTATWGGMKSSVPAQWLSASAVQCTTPSVTMPGAAMDGTVASAPQSVVSVEVSNNDADFTSSAVQYTFTSLPSVVSVAPATAAAGVLHQVTVSGDHFVFSSQLLCRFGLDTVAARFLSRTRVVCTPPLALLPSTYSVSVSNNGGSDFSSQSVVFTVVAAPTLIALAPTFGSLLGGLLLTVRGTKLVASPTLVCSFDGTTTTTVPAVWVSMEEVHCVTPPAAASAGVVTVEVSVNGADFTSNGLTFQYTPPPPGSEVEAAVWSCVWGHTVATVGHWVCGRGCLGMHLCHYPWGCYSGCPCTVCVLGGVRVPHTPVGGPGCASHCAGNQQRCREWPWEGLL